MTTYGITTRGPYWHTHATRISLSTSTHSNANDSISNSIDFASLTIIRVSESAITEPHHTFHSSLRTTARALDERLRYTMDASLGIILHTLAIRANAHPLLLPTRLHTSRALSTYTPKQTYNPPHPHQSLTLLERTHVLIRSDDIITVFSALALSLSRAQRSCLSDSSGRTPRLCPGTASR